jgi:hypothetical protein
VSFLAASRICSTSYAAPVEATLKEFNGGQRWQHLRRTAGRALGMIAGRSKQRQPLYSRHKG